MGIVTDILEFFHPDRITDRIFTFGDFRSNQNNEIAAVNLNVIIKKLLLEGLLLERGGDWNNNPNNAMFQTINFRPHLASYGYYDFFIQGFPYIMQTFGNSVFLFIVRLPNGEETVGTGFLIEYEGEKYVVTAKHNVLKNAGFIIKNSEASHLVVDSVWVSYDDEYSPMGDGLIDIAVLKVQGVEDLKAFQLDNWQILDDVLTIGYPPIPGFDAVQFAETATIAATAVKSTTGQITGEGDSYIGRQRYFLISARVKGGNSGGPVINKAGKVVGVIADGAENNNQMDTMGYGIATPIETIVNVLKSMEAASQSIKVKEVEIAPDENGWTVVND